MLACLSDRQARGMYNRPSRLRGDRSDNVVFSHGM